MVTIIEPADLDGRMPTGWTPDEVQAEIDDALAWVRIYVPCLENLSVEGLAAVKAVLRKAVPYNARAASSPGGTVNRVNAGPLGMSTETTTPRDSGAYFSRAQIQILEQLCAPTRRAGGGTIRTRPL